MKSDKAPGTSQLTTDMLNLLDNALDFVIKAIPDFLHRETDFKAWH
jgi:hypothetical protein